MANLQYANNAAGTLASALTNASTSLTLNTGQAALFPAVGAGQSFYATLTDAATQTLIEIVLVTAVSGNIFSITRGQDGTTALSWNANDIVSQRTTAAELRGFENAAEGVFTSVQIQPSPTLGILGATGGASANTGSVGEYVSGVNAVTPANNVATIVTSFTLTPGDWDVSATFQIQASGGAIIGNIVAGISTTSTFLGLGNNVQIGTTLSGNAVETFPTPVVRINLATNFTVSAIVQVAFSGGAVTATAFMQSRRAR